MPDTITPKLLLTKPEVGASADTWGNKLNSNFDILDLKVVRNTIQWTMTLGDEIPASSTGPFQIKRYNNSGLESGIPVTINRQTGDVALQNALAVAGALSAVSISTTGNLTAAGTTLGAVNATSLVASASVAAGTSLTGATLNISGAATANSYSGATLSLTGNISAAAIGGTGNISGGSFSTTGNATINGTITSGAISNGANIGTATLNASGAIAAGGAITSNARVTGSELRATGAVYAHGSVVYLEATNTRYLQWDGAQYVMPSSHLFTAAGRVWGTSDFNYVPVSPASTVTGVRQASLFDVQVSDSQQVPLGGGQIVVSVSASGSPVLVMFMRIAKIQVLINGTWFDT